jgi:tRNA(adenine34) deaminase
MERFSTRVKRQITALSRRPYQEIAAETVQKRTEWYEARVKSIGRKIPPTPRAAFELFFFEYMGVPTEDLQVVSEGPTHITWRSTNPCPTLQACQALGIDTRLVCREIYESSTQAFFYLIDLRLRFSRSYEEIRPYASYCLESIYRV